jgi:hypothetical protein
MKRLVLLDKFHIACSGKGRKSTPSRKIIDTNQRGFVPQ